MQSEAIAEEVRAAMARRRVRQPALANALGLTQPAVSRRLAGKIEFSVTELHAAAELLEVPVATFLKEAS